MNKFHGNIGFVETVETSPGVWTGSTVLKPYYGDVIKNTRRYSNGGEVNGEISISNSISIVADGYATSNMYAMRFIEWKKKRWTITDIKMDYPRLVLTIGGLYNG